MGTEEALRLMKIYSEEIELEDVSVASIKKRFSI